MMSWSLRGCVDLVGRLEGGGVHFHGGTASLFSDGIVGRAGQEYDPTLACLLARDLILSRKGLELGLEHHSIMALVLALLPNPAGPRNRRQITPSPEDQQPKRILAWFAADNHPQNCKTGTTISTKAYVDASQRLLLGDSATVVQINHPRNPWGKRRLMDHGLPSAAWEGPAADCLFLNATAGKGGGENRPLNWEGWEVGEGSGGGLAPGHFRSSPRCSRDRPAMFPCWPGGKRVQRPPWERARAIPRASLESVERG